MIFELNSTKMIIHENQTRGLADHGWLKSRHTFSFADYYNPQRMNFGVLRVLNDDQIAGGTGFGTHSHRDMEIISIPISGSLEHRDNQGHHQIISQGEVQVMSAGTGIAHSEYNASPSQIAQFLQIWIIPKKMNVAPRYDQKKFEIQDRKKDFQMVVSPNGELGSLMIHQDAYFFLGSPDEGQVWNYQKKMKSNGIYLFLISGEIKVNGHALKSRDAVGLIEEQVIQIEVVQAAEILLMEVPLK